MEGEKFILLYLRIRLNCRNTFVDFDICEDSSCVHALHIISYIFFFDFLPNIFGRKLKLMSVEIYF